MAEPSSGSVTCPLCGEAFDPEAAGGWCTNGDCGEWQYQGGAVPEPIPDAAATPASESARDGDDSPKPSNRQPADQGPAPDGDFRRGSAQTTDGGGTDPGPDDGPAADDGTSGLSQPAPERAVNAETTKSNPSGTEDDPADTGSDGPGDEASPDTAPEPAPDGDRTTTTCPTCESTIDHEDNFCSNCGTELTEVGAQDLTACPSCGDDIEEADKFCASCGEPLDPHREPSAPRPDHERSHIVLRTRGRTVTVSDGDTVGREFRRILTETGGDVDAAVKIHREHVRFLREGETFYLVNLGENPTVVNDERLRKGDRRPVTPGDSISLSNVVTATVEQG